MEASAEEQSAILLTEVDNSASQGYWKTSGGENTQDQVFLLSVAEAHGYMGIRNNTECRVAPTEYAIKKGASPSDKNKTGDGKPAGKWWLRSPGDNRRKVAGVSSAGAIFQQLDFLGNTIRPALWVDLESGIF